MKIRVTPLFKPPYLEKCDNSTPSTTPFPFIIVGGGGGGVGGRRFQLSRNYNKILSFLRFIRIHCLLIVTKTCLKPKINLTYKYLSTVTMKTFENSVDVALVSLLFTLNRYFQARKRRPYSYYNLPRLLALYISF